MKHIFHLITIIFMFYELFWMARTKSKLKKSDEFSEKSKEQKDKEWDEYPEDYKSELIYRLVLYIPILLWLGVGLLSFNWPVFLFFILWGFVGMGLVKKMTKKANFGLRVGIHWVDSLVGFCVATFILLNSYHLKIDVWEIIKALF